MSTQLLLLLVPLVAIQLGLQVMALRDLAKRQSVSGNNKWLWAAVILLGGLLGTILYFAMGKKEV